MIHVICVEVLRSSQPNGVLSSAVDDTCTHHQGHACKFSYAHIDIFIPFHGYPDVDKVIVMMETA